MSLTVETPAYVAIPGVSEGYRLGGTYRSELRALFTNFYNESLNVLTLVITWVVSVVLWATHSEPWSLMILGPLHTTLHLPFSCGNHIFNGIDQVTCAKWRSSDLAATALPAVMISFWLHGDNFTPLIIVTITLQVALVIIQLGLLWRHSTNPTREWNKPVAVGMSAAIVACFLAPMLAEGHWVSTLALVIGGIVFAAGFPEQYIDYQIFNYITGNTLMHVCLTVAHIYEFKWADRH